MKCPRDNSELKFKEIEGISVAFCEICSGVFLNHGELTKITHPTAGDVEYSSTEHIDITKATDLSCPQCKNIKMININFIEYSDILMKYCNECKGIWLDGGELKEINKEIDKINDDTEHWQHSFRVFLSKLPF
jgi:Zn-finger nucleic acid-binding protein